MDIAAIVFTCHKYVLGSTSERMKPEPGIPLCVFSETPSWKIRSFYGCTFRDQDLKIASEGYRRARSHSETAWQFKGGKTHSELHYRGWKVASVLTNRHQNKRIEFTFQWYTIE